MKIPSGMLLCPDNPGRPIDARWQRVADLADCDGRADHKWDDVWVRKGLDYLNRRRACRDQSERDLLSRHDPDLDAAYILRHTADKLKRGEFEGRLLAGQSAEEVASLCGLSLGVVTAYLKLFFDVEGKLDAKQFLLINAIGSVLWDGSLRETDPDVLLKWIGCIKGAILLGVLLRYYKGGLVVPDRLEDASAEQLQELALMLEARALVVTWTRPWPRCMRGPRLCALAQLLRESIPWLTAAPAAEPIFVVAALPTGPDGEAGQVEIPASEWWSAWRSEVLAA